MRKHQKNTEETSEECFSVPETCFCENSIVCTRQ
jgi:hypothetical protein